MINIICSGKLKENYLKEMIDDYEMRIKKYHKINVIEIKDDGLETEASNILKIINPKDYVIVCAIDGDVMDSLEFSKYLDNTFTHFSTITFVIGSSEGIHSSVYSRANKLLSFSKFTLPHGLFRAVLLEQIYRSFKIINNETYHK